MKLVLKMSKQWFGCNCISYNNFSGRKAFVYCKCLKTCFQTSINLVIGKIICKHTIQTKAVWFVRCRISNGRYCN